MARTTETFCLDTENDRDIVRWLERQENKSAAIREALRAHIANAVTLADVYQEVTELRRTIRNGVTVAGAGNDDAPAGEVDPLVAKAEAALAQLGL